MRLVHDEPRVWMDAGPFFRFSEAGKLLPLARFLGSRAWWVQDVANEVELHHSSPNPHLRTHPGLAHLQRIGFPEQPPQPLTPGQEEETNDIRADWAEPDEHPKKHRGEIATVIVARDFGGELAVIDDGAGLALARAHGEPTLSTTHLAVEMVAAGKITEADGQRIYLSVRRKKPLTPESYANALKRYRV